VRCLYATVFSSLRLHCKNVTPLIRKHLLLLMLLAYLPAALAQSGQITGVVKDPHQALVSGAKVTLAGVPLATARTVQTNNQGEYSFTGLVAGEYRIEIAFPGFKTEQIDGVMVTGAGKTEQNVNLALAGSSYSVTVNSLALDLNVKTQPQAVLLDLPEGVGNDSIEFTAKDIENLHPKTLLDVFQQVPGMSQTFQGRQHLDFMGMRGGNFQVILDGVYVSQIDRLMASLPVQLVESMTIVRDSTALSIGPLSSVPWALGTSTSGVGNQGFVIIRTKRAAGNDVGFVSNGGNFGTALGHVYAGSKTGNWDYRGAYTYYNTEGKDTWNMQQRNGSATFHGGYTSSKLTMNFMYYGSRGMRNMEYGEVLAYIPNSATTTSTAGSCTSPTNSATVLKNIPVGHPCTNSMNLHKLDGDLFAFNAVRHWNDKNRTILQYGFDRLIINGGMVGGANTYNANEQDSTEGNLTLKHTYLLKKNYITGGGQYIKYIAPGATAPAVGSRTDQALLSWFVQDEYHLLGNRLVIDGGVRGDKTHTAWNSSLKKANDVWTPKYMTYVLGASYKLPYKTTIGARYGYVSSPVSSNYYYQNGKVLEPSSMLPNQKQNRGELSAKSEWNPHFNPSVSIYIYDTKNGITTYSATCTVPSWATTPTPGTTKQTSWLDSLGNEYICVAQAGDVKTAGTEVGISGRIAGPFTYNTGYGYTGTDSTSINKGITHNYVNASLNYRQKNWFGNFSMVYVGPSWSTSISNATPLAYSLELANYSRVDVNGGYNFKLFGKQMTFTAYERNLTDNNYATMYKTGLYRDPGRQYGFELAGKVF
jgi:hypothetical protein